MLAISEVRRAKTSMSDFAHPWSRNERYAECRMLLGLPVYGRCMLGSAIEEDHVAGMVGEPRG
jgi:hypothetical protein